MTGTSAARQVTRASVITDRDTNIAGRRFYDAASMAWMVKVFPGEFYVTSKSDEMLVTILGSCVSACIRDPRMGVGGMNHFMLPHDHDSGWNGDMQSARYGNFAMEKLINELIKAGCSRELMEVKVFGGSNVIDNRNAVGSQNADFVLRYLKAEGLPCAVQDLGGQYSRRIHYSPATGRVVRRFLGSSDSHVIVREEIEYASRLLSTRTSGEVQLFEEGV